MLDLTVIIVSFNTKKLLKDCIESVVKYTKKIKYEIIVVDNGSTDGSVEMVRKSIKSITSTTNIKGKLIINTKNVGFGAANNQGMKSAKGRYILLLNSDTEISEDSLTKMVQWMDKNSHAGVLSCTLIGPQGSIQLNGGYFPSLFRLFLWSIFLDDIPGIALLFGSYHLSSNIPITRSIYSKVHEQDWVSGAVFLLRKKVFDNLGGFDENIFMYGEEVEYSLRIKNRKWEVWYVPITKILHVGTASSEGELVEFSGVSVGKESSIIGEFNALRYIYKKHYPTWKYPILTFILKLASIFRIIVFGILTRQKEARRIYAKAFKIS